MGDLKSIEDQDGLKRKILSVSPLITDVTFCFYWRVNGKGCRRPTIYIHHKNSRTSNEYHCVHVSSDGLMVNSNGHHDLDVHDAMNEAVKIARENLGC